MVADFTPEVDVVSAPFWASGADGVLRVQRCTDCAAWQHPPRELCRKCLGENLEFAPVSGRGSIWSYTINRQAWSAGLPVPYVIAIVTLDDVPGVRMTARIVGSAGENVEIGVRLAVSFERLSDDVFAPVFEAVDGA